MNKLFVFNAGHEEALRIPLEQNYTPSKEVRALRQDLGSILQVLCQDGDYVWLWADESHGYRLMNAQGIIIEDCSKLSTLDVQLWALDGHTIKLLKLEAPKLELRLNYPLLSDAYLSASHRSFSVKMLNALRGRIPFDEVVIPKWFYPQSDGCVTQEAESRIKEEIDTQLKSIYAQAYTQALLKRSYTSSGRGLYPFKLSNKPYDLEKVLAYAKAWGGLSIEPLLDLQENWAVEYYLSLDGTIEFVALSQFKTNKYGTYQANILDNQSNLYDKLNQHLGGKLDLLLEAQMTFLKEELGTHYEGYIGVDMLVYKSPKGEKMLQPVVEVNLRCTMGLLAHKLYEQAMSKTGLWEESEGFSDERTRRFTHFKIDYVGGKSRTSFEAKISQLKLLTPYCSTSSFVAYFSEN